MAIEVVNEKGKPETHRGDGHLYFRKPHDLGLNIGKDLIQDTALWVGSNSEWYWLFDMAPPKGEPKVAYRGLLAEADHPTAPRLRLPITANRLIDLLAVTDLPEAAFEGPAYFLHGGASPYVPPETHPRIRALFPDAEIEALPGAGHWLHAEQPEAFLGKVEGWLSGA